MVQVITQKSAPSTPDKPIKAITKKRAPATPRKPTQLVKQEPAQAIAKEPTQAMTQKPTSAITQKPSQAIAKESGRIFTIEPVRPMGQQSVNHSTQPYSRFSFKTPGGKKESVGSNRQRVGANFYDRTTPTDGPTIRKPFNTTLFAI